MSTAPPKWATRPHDDVMPGVEVRLNPDGTIDEIVVDRPVRFHMEQMDDGCFWIGLSDGDRRQCITLNRHGMHIYPTVDQ